jgi:hypothetical protein
MPDGHENDALRDLLEHERARLFAARRVREQLAAIAAQAPGYLITTEHYPADVSGSSRRRSPRWCIRTWS